MSTEITKAAFMAVGIILYWLIAMHIISVLVMAKP